MTLRRITIIAFLDTGCILFTVYRLHFGQKSGGRVRAREIFRLGGVASLASWLILSIR